MKMKNFFKYVGTSLALAAFLYIAVQPYTSFGFTVTGNITNSTTPAGNQGTPIFTNGVSIYKIVLTSTNTTAQNSFIQFFDSPSSKITNSNPAYNTAVLTVTNVNTNYVNIAGVTETFTNQELIIVTNTYAASNFTYRPIINLLVQTNNSITYTPVTPLVCTLGLLATGSIGATYTIDYIPYK